MTPGAADAMTPEAFAEAVRRLLEDIPVMTLATCANGAPWAADVYFAPLSPEGMKEASGFELVFFSSPNSRHCRHLADNPACAATVHAQASRVKDIRGLQMEGAARLAQGPIAKTRALAAYLRKFPFVKELFANPVLTAQKLGGAAAYVFSPTRIRYVDNARGFGARYAATVDNGAALGPPVLEKSGDAPSP